MTGQLIYVAHPYGGDGKNKASIDDIMKDLVLKDKYNTYLSPIHNFSMVYFEKRYAKGLEICLDMLDKCSILILCGDWQKSRGCIGEWSFAKAMEHKIYTLDEWKAYIETQGDISR